MIALVTGGTGFVGAYLLRLLLDDPQYTVVRAIRRKTSAMNLVAEFADRVEWHEGDILDSFSLEEAMQGVAHVYHAAAYISFQDEDREKMFKANIEGTENVVNAALYCGVKRLGYVSSIAALGRNKDKEVLDETNKWQNDPLNSNYAISKFHAEQEVWRGAAEGLSVVIINPSIIVGSGNWHGGSPNLFRQVGKGLKFYPQGKTGFVDVRDVARSLHLLVNTPSIENERFVINTANWSHQQFLNTVADALKMPRPSIAVTFWIRELAWRFFWLKHKITRKKSIITRETMLSSSFKFEYLNTKFTTQFPDYQFIDLETTITETAAIYNDNCRIGLLD